ncbi:UNVERIFIED_CONTAM: DNA (cytosine-5)-methyltransferase 3B [Trichonephila clavipes]
MPKRGDFVWAKMQSYPWWPAVIIEPNDCGRDEVAENSFWVFWFGDHKVTEMKSEKLLDFKQHFTKSCVSNIGKSLKHAIEEVLVILARRHHIKFSDQSSLFDWAKKGFKTKLPTSYVKSNSSELPPIVLNALKSSKFQRKCESESEEEDKSEICKFFFFKNLKNLFNSY